MINPRNLILLLLILILAITGTVNADEFNAPPSVKICGYVAYCNEMGVWWFNPPDVTDYSGVQIYLDDVYLTTTTAKGQHFYDFNSTDLGIHVFSTRTIDSFGNINQSWVNLSLNIDACPSCSEGWYCDKEYCMNVTPTVQPTVTPTITPTSWVNQTYNATSDICTIRADMGETWVRWDAVCNTSVEVLYFIDGKKLENTTPYEPLDPDRLILSDLNGMEKHNLKIYYLGNIIAESEISTLPSWYMILFFIVVSLTLSVTALLFVRSPIYRIIMSLVAASFAIWMMTVVTGWMLAVPVIPALFAGLVIILALRDQIELAWGS